jgi:hypothetical protein
MRIKKICLFIFPIILFLFFGIFFMTSCIDATETIDYIIDDDDPDLPSEPPEEIKKQADEAMNKAQEEIDAESESEYAEESDEQDESIPKESISLEGEIWDGSELTLIINLTTGKVGGSIKFKDKENTYNGTISGNINSETYKINAICSGPWESKVLGKFTITVTIKGQLNEDLDEAMGTSTNDEGETVNWIAFK